MILKFKDIATIRKKWNNQKIVCASGTFDLIHHRHINFLNKIQKLGDKTVILINHDWRVRQKKGPYRPINPQLNRAKIIAAIKGIDAVALCPHGPRATERCLEKLKPDIYASIEKKRWKNGDKFFKKNNIKFIHITRERGGSTTQTVKKILKAYEAR